MFAQTFPALLDVKRWFSWLRTHPEVVRYVVLDDDDDCLDELPLFQPSSKTGLTPEIARGIEEFLIGRSDQDMRANALARLGKIFTPYLNETRVERSVLVGDRLRSDDLVWAP
jgi:hypothetical protein